jgi:cation diffusion facilitator CzcD-associated flavoprotein CzcO
MALEHVDVLIVGAGLSGIAAAHHLKARCPGRSFAIVEARGDVGGTWDLFRYPGVRSDSDMYTLGFSFRPWTAGRSFADGPSIREYVRETAREDGTASRIRFNRRVVRASWSSEDARWTVEIERTDGAGAERLTAAFLFTCTGYYRYDRGHTPALPGAERFGGRIVHPQQWTDEVDYDGKRVVIIGSGATAVTLAPAMAARAAHVTMLQRSPSYVVALPGQDPLADRMRRLLPARAAHGAIRWKNVLLTMASYQLSRRAPRVMRTLMRRGVLRRLPVGYPVDTHFSPRYDPWDQRVCLVPDGDLFRAIGEDRVSVVTDRVAGCTERGLALESGAELAADVVVTATGLELLALGGMTLEVDGRPVDLPRTVSYKGLMLSGVPNLAIAMGYTNASWTLKCELICEYVCRLLNHMQAHGQAVATPRAPEPSAPTRPFIDLTSGYVQRSIAHFPRQGPGAPWVVHQNYLRDIAMLRHGPVGDGMAFAPAARRPPAQGAGGDVDGGAALAVAGVTAGPPS